MPNNHKSSPLFGWLTAGSDLISAQLESTASTVSKKIDDTFEKKKHAKDKRIITNKANLKIFTSSIFLPTQINNKLLHKVADA